MRKSVKSLFVFSVLVLVALMTFGACSKPADKAKADDGAKVAEKVYKIRYATNSAEKDDKTNSAIAGMKAGIKYMEEKSNGRIQVQVFWGSQLGTTAEDVIGGCQNGAFEMFGFAHGNWGEYTDALVPFNIPYLFTSQEAVTAFIAGEGGQSVRDKILADTGLRVLGLSEYGFRNMTSNRGIIKSPADMKGLKLRTMTDRYQIEAMKTLGASPTPIAWAELFSALQQGVVDAQENPLVNIYTTKLYEVQKYLSFTKHNVSISTMTINENFFQSMPKDLQQIMIDAGKVSQDVSLSELAAQEKDIIVKLQEPACGPMQLYWPTKEELKAFQEVVKGSWPKIAADIGEERFNKIVKLVEDIDKELSKK